MIYYAALATVIFSNVKITCYFSCNSLHMKITCYLHIWKDHCREGCIVNHTFCRKNIINVNWFGMSLIGVYIIKLIINITLHGHLEIPNFSSHVVHRTHLNEIFFITWKKLYWAVYNGSSKNMGLGKYWPNLNISEVIVMGLEVSFLGDFVPQRLNVSLELQSHKVSNLPFHTSTFVPPCGHVISSMHLTGL